MTTTTATDRSKRRRATPAFTLVELLVALGVSGAILAAVLTTLVLVTKGGIRLMAFHDIESRGSHALQQFATDARQASDATWVSANQLNLEVPATGTVSYTYTSANGTLSRATSAGSRTLATDLDSFRFVAYDRDGDAVALDAIDVNTRTKMVQMELRCRNLDTRKLLQW